MAKSTVQEVADVAKGAGTLVKGAATVVMGAAKGAKGVAMAVGKTPLAAAAVTALGVAAVREHSKSDSTGTQSKTTAKRSSVATPLPFARPRIHCTVTTSCPASITSSSSKVTRVVGSFE